MKSGAGKNSTDAILKERVYEGGKGKRERGVCLISAASKKL